MSILLIILSAIVSRFINKVSGSGPVISRTLNTGEFTHLAAHIKADIYYTPGTFHKVEILAQQNIMDIIEVPVINGVLKLQFDKYRHVSDYERVAVFITAPSLEIINKEQLSAAVPQFINI